MNHRIGQWFTITADEHVVIGGTIRGGVSSSAVTPRPRCHAVAPGEFFGTWLPELKDHHP